MDADRFKGKVALVTGGSSGLGKAMAIGFAREGAKVVIADIKAEEGRAVVADLMGSGLSATFVYCDVSKEEDCKNFVEAAKDTYGRIDILINNAGESITGTIEELSMEDFYYSLGVNMIGPLMLMKATIPVMRKINGGSIVNIASLAGLRATPKKTAYCSTKAGLIHLSKQVALDYGRYNIRCNVVCPGLFITDMVAKNFANIAKELGVSMESFVTAAYKELPLKQPAQPEKIYGLVSFLASDAAAYITGAEILIDGGTGIVDPFSVGIANAITELKR